MGGTQRPDGRGTEAAPKKAIRYGLAAIKNVGQAAMELAIREREEGTIHFARGFLPPLDSRIANRKILENLVKCGRLRLFGRERAAFFACIDDSLARGDRDAA